MNINFIDLNLNTNDVKFENGTENFMIEFSGTFILNKGSFMQEFCYWARVYEHNIANFLLIDDYDVSIMNTKINNIKIDEIHKFTNMLINSGLKSLSDNLVFSDYEIKQGMYKAIKTHKLFNILFNTDTKFFNELTEIEQNKLNLKWVIDTYDKRSDYEKSKFFKTSIVPTLDELKEFYNNTFFN